MSNNWTAVRFKHTDKIKLIDDCIVSNHNLKLIMKG